MYAGLVVFLTTQILSIVVVSMLRLTHDAVWQKRVGPARAALEAQGKPRTSSQRWTLGSLGVLSLVGFAIVWNYSFVHFKYEGLLTQDGLFYSNNPLKTSLHDLAVGSYLSDPIPIDNYNVLSTACRLPPAACRLPPAACRLPPAACRLLPAARCPLPTAHRSPPNVHHRSTSVFTSIWSSFPSWSLCSV